MLVSHTAQATNPPSADEVKSLTPEPPLQPPTTSSEVEALRKLPLEPDSCEEALHGDREEWQRALEIQHEALMSRRTLELTTLPRSRRDAETSGCTKSRPSTVAFDKHKAPRHMRQRAL